MSELYIVIKENRCPTQPHYYGYLALLKKMMVSNDKKTVDRLFNLQFSLHTNRSNVNEQQIKILSRILCRENLDSLLQSTWFLRKKHCLIAITKEDIRNIIEISHSFHTPQSYSIFTVMDWDQSLKATVNINEHMRLIQAIIKPLFVWWVQHITPQLFTLYETKKELEFQIMQCENIKSFAEKQLSNTKDSFLSLDDINIKLSTDNVRLIVIDDLLQKSIQSLLEHWETEPAFNIEITNTLDYIREVTPSSELLKPLWKILNSIPEYPENCQKLKDWLLERNLCLKNDLFLWK